ADAHRALYGFDLPGVTVEIVTLRIEAAGRLPAPAASSPAGGEAAEAQIGAQTMRLPDGPARVPVYDRARLGPGARFDGPAIATQLDATTLVPRGWRAVVLATGAL